MSQSDGLGGEIDLGELFSTIRYHAGLISLCGFLSAIFSGYYAYFVAEPAFVATSKFELLDDSESASGLGQVTGLASLAGIVGGATNNEAETLEDRILSRPFIASIYEEAALGTDPIFNGSLEPPSFVGRMKLKLKGEVSKPTKDDLHVMAIGALSDRLEINLAENGIIELKVTHKDSRRASEIANIVVHKALDNIFHRKREETRESLGYFADELLKVRSDLDAANAAVRDYALKNSLKSVEELAVISSQLSQVRRDIGVIEASQIALLQMESDTFSGSEFAEKYPVSTSLSFRRLLGLNGDPSKWLKPSNEAVEGALEQLDRQISPLISTLNALNMRAEEAGSEALELAVLEREVEVQKAIYESVITQFEARSLFSGYEKASGNIIEDAIAPSGPSWPNGPLFLAFGFAIGVVFGSAVVLIRAATRGTFYSSRSLTTAFQEIPAKETHELLASVTNKGTAFSSLVKRGFSQDFLSSLGDRSNCISFLTSCDGEFSFNLATELANTIRTQNQSCTIVDLSNSAMITQPKKKSAFQRNAIDNQPKLAGVDVFVPPQPEQFLKRMACAELVANMQQTYDRVLIVLPKSEYGTAWTRFFLELSDSIVVAVELGRTRRHSINLILNMLTRSKHSDHFLVIS